MSRRIVRVTQTFYRNLEEIRQLLEGQGASGAFSALLQHLSDGDYLILCAVGSARIQLLSSKLHRQLSFDLKAHWTQR